MSFGIILSVVFLVVWGVSLSSTSKDLTDLLLVNAAVQMALFILVACIPFLRKGRMSYVDIAWPFGVALTGAKPAEYYSVRKRPEYKRYQEKTSMFFPWFPKE